MTRDELFSAVPVHEHDGRSRYVNTSEIPEPWQAQFLAALRGSQCPVIAGVERAAYARDWLAWLHGEWHGRRGPEDLQP